MKHFRTGKFVIFSQIFCVLTLFACGGSDSQNDKDKKNSNITQNNQPLPQPQKEKKEEPRNETKVGGDTEYATINGTIEVLNIVQNSGPYSVGTYYQVIFNFIMDGPDNDPELVNEISKNNRVNESQIINVVKRHYQMDFDIIEECLLKQGIREGARVPGYLKWSISGDGTPYLHQFKEYNSEKCVFQ